MAATECVNEDYFCILQATVPTGFEQVASKECNALFGTCSTFHKAGGRVNIPVRLQEDVLKAKQLRSVDHIQVLIKECPNFCENAEKALEVLGRIPDQISWERSLEVWKMYNPDLQLANVSFRVTCHRSGKNIGFGSPDVARVVGSGVNEKFGWKVDLERFDLEVIVYVIELSASLLIGLNRESFHVRNIVHFGPTVLRATVCYGLLHLADIRAGDTVLDPMCGSGSISIEGALAWPHSYHLAGDIHELAAPRTQSNIQALEDLIKVDVLQWDITHLPIRTGCIDVLVTDLPFGKKLGNKQSNRVLYPKAVDEMARVSRLEIGRAVLLTADSKALSTVLAKTLYWSRRHIQNVNVGGLKATVFVLRRTKRPFL